MASKFETFKALHAANSLFILPNAWDAHSATILEKLKYPAVGTSSAAVATSLGYTDGENMPFSEYLFVVQRIAASVNIPVTVDMEMGYGKTAEAILENVQKLLDIGVVGINLEDSQITGNTRTLKNAETFAHTIEFLSNKLSNALFINVRCDTFLLNVENKENETAHRLKIYESAGADGIFLPVIRDAQHMAAVVQQTRLPLNVMAVPDLPDLKTLTDIGVKRVSMGPFLHNKTYDKVKELAATITDYNTLEPLF